MALAALLEDEADLPMSPDGDEDMEGVSAVEGGDFSAQLNVSSPSSALEACLLGNEEVMIPSELCLNSDIFIDVMTQGWASLSDQERSSLLRCLPSFPEPENNDFQEKLTTLDGLFAGANFHFGNPLKQFHASLNAGFYQPDVYRLREVSRKLKFHAHLERQQKHAVSLLCELATSREQMLLDARCLPPSAMDSYRLNKRTGGTADKKPLAAKRARTRYLKVMFEVRQEAGWLDTSSSGEENEERSFDNQIDELSLGNGTPLDEDIIVKSCLKMRSKVLKKMKKDSGTLSSSTPPPPPLDISDVLERAEIKPVTLTAGKVPKHASINGSTPPGMLPLKTKKPGVRRSKLEMLKVQCSELVRKNLTNPPAPPQVQLPPPPLLQMKSVSDMPVNSMPPQPPQPRSRPQSSVALTPTPPPSGMTNIIENMQTSPGNAHKESSTAPVMQLPAPLMAATSGGKVESFFHVVHGILVSSAECRATLATLEQLVKQWVQIAQTTLNSPSPASWSLRWINDRSNWHQELPSALRFLTGTFCPANYPENFAPLVDMNDRSGHWVWLEDEVELNPPFSQYMTMLYRYWLDAQLAERQITPSTTPFHPESEQDMLLFHDQERRRYSAPTEPFVYFLTVPMHRELVVGPVRVSASRVDSFSSSRNKGVKDHSILTTDRPAAVTVLTLVRDAVARLAAGEGTRTDICNLLRDSQFIRRDLQSSQLTNAVSGALDRLHSERDPCVRFDTTKKLWIYLHRGRTRDDFLRIGQMLLMAAKRRQNKDNSLASANATSAVQAAALAAAAANPSPVVNGAPGLAQPTTVLPSPTGKAPGSASKGNSRRASAVNNGVDSNNAGNMLQRKSSVTAGFSAEQQLMPQHPVMIPHQTMQPQQLPSPSQPPAMYNGPPGGMIRGPIPPQLQQQMQPSQASPRQPIQSMAPQQAPGQIMPAQNAPGMVMNWPPSQIALQMQQMGPQSGQIMSPMGPTSVASQQQPQMMPQMHIPGQQLVRHAAPPMHMMAPGPGMGSGMVPGPPQMAPPQPQATHFQSPSSQHQYHPQAQMHHHPQHGTMHHGMAPQSHMAPNMVQQPPQQLNAMMEPQYYADHGQQPPQQMSANSQQQQMLMYHHQTQQQQQYRLVHHQVASPNHHPQFSQQGPPNMMPQQPHPGQFQSHPHI